MLFMPHTCYLAIMSLSESLQDDKNSTGSDAFLVEHSGTTQ